MLPAEGLTRAEGWREAALTLVCPADTGHPFATARRSWLSAFGQGWGPGLLALCSQTFSLATADFPRSQPCGERMAELPSLCDPKSPRLQYPVVGSLSLTLRGLFPWRTNTLY